MLASTGRSSELSSRRCPAAGASCRVKGGSPRLPARARGSSCCHGGCDRDEPGPLPDAALPSIRRSWRRPGPGRLLAVAAYLGPEGTSARRRAQAFRRRRRHRAVRLDREAFRRWKAGGGLRRGAGRELHRGRDRTHASTSAPRPPPGVRRGHAADPAVPDEPGARASGIRKVYSHTQSPGAASTPWRRLPGAERVAVVSNAEAARLASLRRAPRRRSVRKRRRRSTG
jgi:hypothetical protein